MTDKHSVLNINQPDPDDVSKATIKTRTAETIIDAFMNNDKPLSASYIASTVVSLCAATVTISAINESSNLVNKATNIISNQWEWIKFYSYFKKDTIEIKYNSLEEMWTYNNLQLDLFKLAENSTIRINGFQNSSNYWAEFTTVNKVMIKVVRYNDTITFTFPIDSNIKSTILGVLTKSKKVVQGITSCFQLNHTPKSSVSPGNTDSSFEGVQFSVAIELPHYKEIKSMLIDYKQLNKILCPLENKFIIPKALNFNGQPGTGKTTFCSYMSELNIFDMVILVPMNQGGEIKAGAHFASNRMKSFSDILEILSREINKKKSEDSGKKIEGNKHSLYILVMFDEIDKYLKKYIEIAVEMKRISANTSKNVTVKDNTAKTEKTTEEKIFFNEEDERREETIHKNAFLDRLLMLLDQGLNREDNFVFVFNTNEAETLYSNTDSRHATVRTRIEKYEFNKIGKKDIIKFVNNFYSKIEKNLDSEISLQQNEINDNFKNAASKYKSDKLEYERNMSDDIVLSYRKLDQILKNNARDPDLIFKQFELGKIVEKLECIDIIKLELDIDDDLFGEIAESINDNFRLSRQECDKLIELYRNDIKTMISELNEQSSKFGDYN